MSSPQLIPLSSSPPRTTDAEESGEELLEEGLIQRDYQAIPELDRYDTRELDEGDYDPLDVQDRRAADRAMSRRDREARHGSGRGPALLSHTSDDEEETRVQRRISEDEEAADLPEVRGQIRADRAMEDDDDEEEAFVNLDDFRGPLDEYLVMEAPRAEIRRRFRMFLTEFPGENGHPMYPRLISQMCSENRQSLEVSYLDLSKTVPILAIWVADEPAMILELFDQTAMEVALSVFPWYKDVHNSVHVRITRLPIIDRIRDLRQAHLKALIKVIGVVTRRTSVFPQLKMVRFNCGKCGQLTREYSQTGETLKMPVRCPECQGQGIFIVNSEQTIYQNYQKITLQESPGTVPAGRVPRQKDVILLHDLIDTCSPGEEVEITGIYQHNYDVALNYQNGFPVFSTTIMANHVIRKSSDGGQRLTDEDVREIIKLSKAPNLGDIIFNSIAPSIYGHKNIKMALALSLFSGVPKQVAGGARIRGDINLLILGDPGVAKSQFLKYAEKTAKRAVYATGKGASAVGLTAGVRKDPVTREWTLEGGALVLADQGICLIDEFDKMNDQDRTSIHEAMEQQTISVAKAGIITTLKARCAVIAAANPLGGRYDSSQNFTDNVDLTDPILSRFDVLCVVRDLVDHEQDKRLADFVIGIHVKAHPNSPPETTTDGDKYTWEKDGKISQDLLKKYIAYAREKCHPKLHNIDDDKIANLYGELRRASMDTGGIPIAVRHIESLVRMSEAHAKMHLRDVTSEDVDMSIRIMLESFIGAQKFQVMRSLRKQFQKYLSVKQDSFELLMYILNSHVNDQITFRRLQRRTVRDPTQPEEPVTISRSEFEQRAAELEIMNLNSFYKSSLFSAENFTIDRRRNRITKTYN